MAFLSDTLDTVCLTHVIERGGCDTSPRAPIGPGVSHRLVSGEEKFPLLHQSTSAPKLPARPARRARFGGFHAILVSRLCHPGDARAGRAQAVRRFQLRPGSEDAESIVDMEDQALC